MIDEADITDMSRDARWTIACVAVACSVSFAYVAFTVPPGVLNRQGLWIISAFCALLAVACFPGRFRMVAVRLVGASVCAVYIGYIISEIGQPLPTLSNYSHGNTNLVNALIGFIEFGVPGGCIAIWGGSSKHFQAKRPSYRYRTVRYLPSQHSKSSETAPPD